jgi:tRNA (cytidine/uridine-2'-O-)-methyltransferase
MSPVRAPLFEVVLHEPEIPNNTGNIGRTCVALGCSLHLIHPLGFSLDEKARRRAGLDYWSRLDVREHADWGAYERGCRGARRWCLTTRASRPVFEADLRAGDHLVFGKETGGLPEEVIDGMSSRAVCLPMAPGERSLNLATAVCAVLYEGVRQALSRGDIALEGGRIVFPDP